MRILFAVRTRVPGEGSSAQGKSGPKVRPKGVIDGQQVKIPALLTGVMEGRIRLIKAELWLCPLVTQGCEGQKIYLTLG